jgi:formylglycine-generating enzyme required for sulfatase activity
MRAMLLLFAFAACSGSAEEGAAPSVGGNEAEVVSQGQAATPPADFATYTQDLLGAASFDMIAIQGGTFVMGSASSEAGRADHEGPQHAVKVEPFWMGRCEVTWDEYDVWYAADLPQTKMPDGVSKPTPPYVDMTFNMGRDGYPAICMSHVAARQYCVWLSRVTGHFYRLPTEAEWEYACRAGSTTPWSCGADVATLADHAWFDENSDESYHAVGSKKPNAWGLHDMHGNVAEWVADHYLAEAYADVGAADNPFFPPPHDRRGRPIRFPHIVRGGSWQEPSGALRSAARRVSERIWNKLDPQLPKSWWYLTEGQHVGFRVVRPLREPSAEERARFEAL